MDQETLDIVWLAFCTCLVFFMQAGFAMLESGLVRAKNAVNVLMKNYVDMGFAGIAFWAIGYGLMFGYNPSGWFGSDRFFLNVADDREMMFMLFQLMFASTAATIVSGALAERIRYWSYIAAAVVISSVIYALYGSWAWGAYGSETSGWLRQLGFIDFAGSTVIHSIGGWCALAGVLVLGPRLGRFSSTGKVRAISGHNLPLVALGGIILWLGWFGFNGGSLLEANSSIGRIILNTHLAGAAGVVAAVTTLGIVRKPILMTSSINGGLGGMVAICASCNVISPAWAILVGLVAGVLVIAGGSLMDRLRLDDAVGAVPVHGLCGLWGTIAVGLFRTGDLFNTQQVGVQLLGAATAFLWAFPTAWVLFKVLNGVIGLRVDSSDERKGLDYAEHYEVAYPEFQSDFLHAGKD